MKRSMARSVVRQHVRRSSFVPGLGLALVHALGHGLDLALAHGLDLGLTLHLEPRTPMQTGSSV